MVSQGHVSPLITCGDSYRRTDSVVGDSRLHPGSPRSGPAFHHCGDTYPPDLKDAAVQTVLEQAEALLERWAA